MNKFTMFIIAIELFLFVISLLIIVFLIFKRIKDKKKENFEDRTN